MIEVSGVRSSCETRATNSSFSRSSSRSRSFWAPSSPACTGQRALGPDLGGDVARDPERADDLAVVVAERHLGRGHPGVRPAREGLAFHLAHDRLTGADDLLLVRERRGGMLLGEHVEIGLPGQLRGGPARGDGLDPGFADEQEPAHQVLEVDALLGAGQQVAQADELELAQRLAACRPRLLGRGLGYGDPPSDRRVTWAAPCASCPCLCTRFAARWQLAPAIWYIRRSMGLNGRTVNPGRPLTPTADQRAFLFR